MYKILIVDDEKIERKGISLLFRRMDIECDLAEAVNGQDALEYLMENEADILLTDVKMPHMDGIELIRQIKDRDINQNMKIIIISGYSDFEYAKLAVKLGVSDYILKPVDPKEFEATMKKTVKELEDKKLEQDIVEKGTEFLRQHYLYSLVNGLNTDNLQQMQVIGGEWDMKYKRLMLLEFSNNFFGKADTEFTDNLKQCLDESGAKYQYLNLNTEQCVIFFEGDGDKDYWENIARKILNMIKYKYDATAYIAVSSEFFSAEEITKVFDEAENLMGNRFYQTDTKVYFPYDKSRYSADVALADDTVMKQMKQDIKMKDMDSLRHHLEDLYEKYKNNTDYSQMYIKFVFCNILKDCYDNIPNAGELELNSEIEKLYKAADFNTVVDIININVKRLEETFSANPQVLHRQIESVKQYIYEHYGEELGVEQLADMVYMAPSYLSCVFKKETGQNLSKFIKAYRMEKAKELLENSHKKIVTISEQVGYSNVSYFCQSFREYFGISPQKYRSQGEG